MSGRVGRGAGSKLAVIAGAFGRITVNSIEILTFSLPACIDDLGVAMQRSTIIAGALFGLAQGAVPAAAQGLLVAEGSFAHTVDADRREIIGPLASSAPVRPIHFWTRIRVDRAYMAQLKREGRLPISHRWLFEPETGALGPRVEPSLQDAKSLDVGSPETAAALEWQLRAHGFVEWRTWSLKEIVMPGDWWVQVVDKRGTTLRCYVPGAPSDECEFRIKLVGSR